MIVITSLHLTVFISKKYSIEINQMLERLPTWDKKMCTTKNPVLQAMLMEISYNLLNLVVKNAAIDLDGYVAANAQLRVPQTIYIFHHFSPIILILGFLIS